MEHKLIEYINNNHPYINDRKTVTLTFGDHAENHVGMQKIGSNVQSGYTHSDLLSIQKIFKSMKFSSQLIEMKQQINILEESAHLLVIRNGVEAFFSDSSFHVNPHTSPKTKDLTSKWYDILMYKEQIGLDWDKKAKMYGVVRNKVKRYNLCFDHNSQVPNYEEGKGRIISYSEVPYLAHIQNNLSLLFGEKAKNLVIEGNLYHDINKCGIGYHGDSERKIVIGIRLGCPMKFRFRWFYQRKKVGNDIDVCLNSGDIYIMSEKAVGYDWKYPTKLTLRHAAGGPNIID